jgi:hypothetical protein
MKTLIIVVIAMVVVISIISIRQERINKGYKPNAKDGDGDGLVQDGTKWERKK